MEPQDGPDFSTAPLEQGVDTMPGWRSASPWDQPGASLDPMQTPPSEQDWGTDTLMRPRDPTEYYLPGQDQPPDAVDLTNPSNLFEARGVSPDMTLQQLRTTLISGMEMQRQEHVQPTPSPTLPTPFGRLRPEFNELAPAQSYPGSSPPAAGYAALEIPYRPLYRYQQPWDPTRRRRRRRGRSRPGRRRGRIPKCSEMR
jgi:hypothetical protein